MDRVLASLNSVLFKIDQMDDAEVDAPDIIAVVIDQPGDALMVRPGDLQFLMELAIDSPKVGIMVEMLGMGVAIIHVSTDS